MRALEELQAEELADDVEIDFDKMKRWTSEQVRTYFTSGGQEEPPPAPLPRPVTTTAELLSVLGLQHLEGALSRSEHAPVTLDKCLAWGLNGLTTVMVHLVEAGVSNLSDRKALTFGILGGVTANQLQPAAGERAPVAPWRAVAPVAAGTLDGDFVRLPDGRRIRIRQYGKPTGFPIFFLHGNVSCRLFEPLYADTDVVTARLGVRVIAFDRPGIGDSDPHPGRTYATATADLASIAGALGLGKYAILGFSSGAVHTLASLSLRPGEAAAYGMMSTDGPYWMMRKEPPSVIGTTKVDDAPADLVDADAKVEDLKAMVREMISFFVPEGHERKAALRDVDEASKQGLRPMAEDYNLERVEWPFLEASTERRWNKLVMWQGTKDDAVHPESANYLAKLLPGVKLNVINGATHDDVPRKHWATAIKALLKLAGEA